jgi:23S rRNA (guanosine2251-2'-O)-methyltransferase
MLDSFKNKQKIKISLVLADFRSVQNTASIFRIADCIGVSHLFLVGTTPTPHDKYKRLRADFIKISLGAEKLPHTYFESLDSCIQNLKKNNVTTIGVEQHASSVDYKSLPISIDKEYAIMLFNEPYGASQEYISLCDHIIEIPQYGEKESLNVTSVAAIVLYRMFDL